MAGLQIQLIIPADNGVIGSRGWYGALGYPSIVAIGDQHFPFAVLVLQGVEVKCKQVVEKVSFDLTAKYIYL